MAFVRIKKFKFLCNSLRMKFGYFRSVEIMVLVYTFLLLSPVINDTLCVIKFHESPRLENVFPDIIATNIDRERFMILNLHWIYFLLCSILFVKKCYVYIANRHH